MNRRTWICRAVGLTAAALLPGCALLGGQPLQVTLVGMESLPGEGMEIRMAMKLRVQNPNDAPIDYDGISVSLALRGTTFATGVSDERGTVPRFGESVIVVPVSVSAMNAVRQIFGFATNIGKQQGPIEYALRGSLSGGLGGAPFETTGVIDLSNLMQSK